MQTDGPANVGRPHKALRLNREAGYAIGIHIDVGLVHSALVDLSGRVIKASTIEHPLDASWKDVLDETCGQVNLLIEGLLPEKILGVGVAASGLVDPFTGVNVYAPNLHWYDVPLRDYLGEKLGLPIIVENNARAMAFGESLFGVARGVGSTAFVYARYGVGAGFVVNGQLFRGSAAGAGEVGHTKILLQEGNGSRRVVCLEDLISEPAILRGVREIAHTDDLTLREVFCAARAGETAILSFLRERAFHTGLALANLVNIFNPDLIVLGGILAQYADMLLPDIRETAADHAFGKLADTLRIEATALGEQAGMIGAAALVLGEMFIVAYGGRCHDPRLYSDCAPHFRCGTGAAKN